MLSKVKKIALGVAALTGAAVGGAAVAGAATSLSAQATAGAATATHPPPGMKGMPAPGTAAHDNAEKAVTGEAAARAKAAAVKAAGGGSAGDVTTDYFGNGYEVTVTMPDGTRVELHLDSSFHVVAGPGGCNGESPPSGSSS